MHGRQALESHNKSAPQASWSLTSSGSAAHTNNPAIPISMPA